MPYMPTVQSRIQLATTNSTSANLGATLFVTDHVYFFERMRGYTSWDEVLNDPAIPAGSDAYNALRLGFTQTGCVVPLYLGRREVDITTLTFDVKDNTEYTFKVTTLLESNYTQVSYDITFTSDSDATEAEIVAGVSTALVNDIPVGVVLGGTGTNITITADTGYQVAITHVSDEVNMAFTTSETAANLLAGLIEENAKDWYFLTTNDHTEAFVLAMAAEIEATESSDYPKQYHISLADTNILQPLMDPPSDTPAKLKDLGYVRTVWQWHQDADTLFPEVANTCYNGQFQAGSTTWKFMVNLKGVNPVRDPITGKLLTTARQGYIADRNGNWQGIERDIRFAHGGKTVGGEWIDVIRGKDWLNDQIEKRLLDLLLNQVGSKLAYVEADYLKVEGTINKILQEAVGFKLLSGYIGAKVPRDINFADKASRLLKNVKWTGYLAGAIHFIVVDGILTYSEEEAV